MGVKSASTYNLKLIERINLRCVEAFIHNPRLRSFSRGMIHNISRCFVEALIGRFVAAHNFEQLHAISLQQGLIVCANHRSYFDNFAVSVRMMKILKHRLNYRFPIRTEGFYDTWYGLFVNLVCSAVTMYPPIIRGARGVEWGKRVVEIITSELGRGDTAVLIHPEGGRNHGIDPYSLMPARPGLGKIIHQSSAPVVPVFLQGFPGTTVAVLKANFCRPRGAIPLVHMVMGAPIDFSAERACKPSARLFFQMANKVNAQITLLGEKERALRRLSGLTNGER